MRRPCTHEGGREMDHRTTGRGTVRSARAFAEEDKWDDVPAGSGPFLLPVWAPKRCPCSPLRVTQPRTKPSGRVGNADQLGTLTARHSHRGKRVALPADCAPGAAHSAGT